jgi:gliding motility-associated-like protein
MLLRLILVISILTGISASLHATHIVGGEITYKCLGHDSFEITLTVYRDCYTGVPWFDDPSAIGVFDSTWNLQQAIYVDFDPATNDTLPIILSNPCLVAPPDVCVHRAVYKAKVWLPNIPGGYTLVYQRCCRNQLIQNIIDPLNTGASFTVQISDKALAECNNGAVFKQWPPVAICVHEPINFDHGATDADGDSLVYRLCTPLNGADPSIPMPQPPNPGPYVPIVWNEPPYNLSNVLGGDPLTINPKTGFLTGVPNTLGNFVVGICVDEYRGGQVISTTRRDFQYNVADCGKPFSAFFTPVQLCDKLGYQFQNSSQNSSNFKWYFDWNGNKAKVSTLQNPYYTFPDTGWYKIALIAQPGSPCSDTAFRDIHVTRTFAKAQLQIQYGSCDSSGLVVKALDQSTDPTYGITDWFWTLTGPQLLQYTFGQNPEYKITKPGDYTLQLIVTAGNGCMDTVTQTFHASLPPIPANQQDSVSICAGQSVSLFPGADPTNSYSWSPPDFLSAANVGNPVATPEQSITYTATVSGSGPCTWLRTVKVHVKDPGHMTVTANPVNVSLGESSQLNADYPGATSYIWSPAATLSNPEISNPVATPKDTIVYTVHATLPDGCTQTGMIELLVVFPSCAEPYVFFPTAFSPNGDGENDILKLECKYSQEIYWVVYNRWGEQMFEAHALSDFWDGTYKGKAMPAETYGYYLRVKCVDGTVWTKKGNVTLLR